MAKKPVKPVRVETAEFDKTAVEELVCAFEHMSSGRASFLDQFLEERGISEEQFDGYLKSIGEVLGRDCGIL